MVDVPDDGHKAAFIYWLSDFLPRAWEKSPEKKKGIAKKAFCKVQLERVRSYSPALRKQWYARRVEIMISDEEMQTSEQPKKPKKKI